MGARRVGVRVGTRGTLLVIVAWLTFATTGCRAILGIHDLAGDVDGALPGSADSSDSSSGKPRDAGPSADEGHDYGRSDAKASDARGDPDTSPATAPDGGAAPLLVASVRTLDFGTALVGQHVTPGQIQLTNAGTASTGPLATSLGGSGFSVTLDACAGVALAPALSCLITVAISTAATGSLTGSVTVTDPPADRVTVALAAKVIAPGQITISPAMKDLGGVPVGSSSGPASFAVTNTGMTATGPLGSALAGTSASELAIVDGCTGKTLAPMATCTVVITLSPVTSGPKTASLAVSGSPGGTGTASLTGSGLAPASLSITPTSHGFQVTLPSTAAPPSMTFVVSNAGSLPSTALTTGLVLASGTVATDFVPGADTCTGQILAAMSSCSVTVQFRPMTVGSKSASLAINGGPLAAMLTGLVDERVPLSVTKSGAGSGTVTDGAGALACGGTCSAQYLRSTLSPMVTLTATPDATSVFAGWAGGGCSGTGPCTVTLAAATMVDARFDLVQEPLTVSFHGLGTQSTSLSSAPAGISCAGSCTSTASFPFGTKVVLKVTQGPSAIVAWSNGCTGTSCSVTTNAAQTVNVTTTNQNIVFVSSQSHDGNFGGIAGANAFCTSAAHAAGVPGQFAALLGTSTASAYSNLGSARGWIRPDGLPFTDTVSGLQNYVMWYPTLLTELGTISTQSVVMTAIDPALGTCGDWTSTSGTAEGGNGPQWEGIGLTSFDNLFCDGSFGGAKFLCFGTDFAVPVSVAPAPGRRVFASAATFDPSRGRDAADALCQTEAAAAGLANATQFLAAMSTTTASAASRFDLNRPPWVRVDGVPTATTAANFMQGTLVSAPYVAANGLPHVGAVGFWSGSLGGLSSPSANANESCNDWSSATATSRGVLADISAVRPGVFSGSAITCDNSNFYSLLCLEK
ncbi:MAG: choice-of-anchor D domain-containing protein [Myxococcota bacterium]|nr:choice-of-anchor D domain-containing protein [Myxococcota bacterium]